MGYVVALASSDAKFKTGPAFSTVVLVHLFARRTDLTLQRADEV